MSSIIDLHTHIFPDYLGKIWPDSVPKAPLEQARRSLRHWLKPFSHSIHRASTMVRYFPTPLRDKLDQLASLAPLPSLLVESTLEDLFSEMKANDVQKSVLIANPYAPSEWILELCQEHPEKLIPAVVVPPGSSRPGLTLKQLAKSGAKLLKIHPAMDGEGVDSPRYLALLKAAADLGIPVILYTGCFHMHLFFKDPDQGQAQRFAPWFREFSQVRFVLAHMNYHEPNIALDVAEQNPNVFVDTSWQPTEVIGEAVRRLGAEKVFFGSDWPMAGQNLAIGIARIRDAVDSGMITQAESQQILGINAQTLLGQSSENAQAL